MPATVTRLRRKPEPANREYVKNNFLIYDEHKEDWYDAGGPIDLGDTVTATPTPAPRATPPPTPTPPPHHLKIFTYEVAGVYFASKDKNWGKLSLTQTGEKDGTFDWKANEAGKKNNASGTWHLYNDLEILIQTKWLEYTPSKPTKK